VRRSLMIIPALVIGFALPAAADDASQALADSSAKQVAAVNKHDAKGWAALFAEDAILVPAGQPIVTGRESIEKWGEVAAKIWNHLDVKREHSSSNGNIAWDTGSYTGNVNLPDGKAVDISGNYVFILQKEGSTWLIKRTHGILIRRPSSLRPRTYPSRRSPALAASSFLNWKSPSKAGCQSSCLRDRLRPNAQRDERAARARPFLPRRTPLPDRPGICSDPPRRHHARQTRACSARADSVGFPRRSG
jgi:ketosteroid isomerase-like protein